MAILIFGPNLLKKGILGLNQKNAISHAPMVVTWSKTAIETTFYFPTKEENVCIRKKSVSVNCTGHDLHASFL